MLGVLRRMTCIEKALPPVWLIAVLVIFPLISESMYSPALPSIVSDLRTTPATAELTLSIYLIGFAVGMGFWGILSDRIGRKPTALYGIVVYVAGCVMCVFAENIEVFLVARIVQALGGSSSSVLAQTIARDAYKGSDLTRVFALVGAFVFLSPALGPSLGGALIEYWSWRFSFVVLAFVGMSVSMMIVLFLPETMVCRKNNESVLSVGRKMMMDKRFLAFCLLISMAQGTFFSYYSEGPFLLIKLLGMRPSTYGMTFTILSISTILGGATVNIMRHRMSAIGLVLLGVIVLSATNVLLLLVVLFHHFVYAIGRECLITLILITRFFSFLGGTLFMSSVAAPVLSDYKESRGTASSIYGLLNYSLVSIFTVIMSLSHNGTIFPMPIYFTILNIFMLCIMRFIIKRFGR